MPHWIIALGNIFLNLINLSGSILQWTEHFISVNFFKIIPIPISIWSLYVSRRLSKQLFVPLDFLVDEKSEWAISLLSDDGRSITNDNGLAIFDIRIINSSSIDIGYFSLRLLDSKAQKEFSYYHGKQMTELNGTSGMDINAAVLSDGSIPFISIPDGSSGTLKSHTATTITIAFHPDENTESVEVLMQVARRKPKHKKVKNGYVNSIYESFFASVLVEQSEKPDYKKLLNNEPDIQPDQENRKSDYPPTQNT